MNPVRGVDGSVSENVGIVDSFSFCRMSRQLVVVSVPFSSDGWEAPGLRSRDDIEIRRKLVGIILFYRSAHRKTRLATGPEMATKQSSQIDEHKNRNRHAEERRHDECLIGWR